MFLTASNLVHYLLATGHLSHQTVTDGDFVAVEAGRRNRNFKMIRQRGPGLFIKQIRSLDPQAKATLQREAACYQLVAANPSMSALAKLTPKFAGYDSKRSILLVELLPEEENLAAYHSRLKCFPADVGATLGRALGACHSEAGRDFSRQTPPDVFPRLVPWILSAHSTNPAWFTELSGANRQLLDILRQYPDFPLQLDRLRSGWRFDALIHGDIKWENCLMCKGSSGQPEFRIVDWELADVGDPAWDVGGLLQAYLVYWVLAMPVKTGTEPSEWVAYAPFRLQAMHPSIHAFWREYTAARGIDLQSAGELFVWCTQYCGARMIQTAFEILAGSSEINIWARTLLQMSLNILKDPRAAARELLAI